MTHFRRASALILLSCAFCQVPAQDVGPLLHQAAAAPATASKSGAAVPADPAADERLAHGVAQRLHTLGELRDVTATVSGRIARLDGEVLSADDRAQAAQIARQHPGVVAVDNRIRLSARFGDRLQVAMRQLQTKLATMLAKVPLLIVAALILVLASWLGGALSRRIRLERLHKRNPYLDALVARTVRWGILLAGILVALELLEWTSLIGALLGSAGVVGLALGFAFRDIAENYVAGILLSLRRPFAPGDQIVIESYEGKVVALTSRSTLLMTLDGNQLTLPNALVFKSVVLNYSQNPKRRFDFSVPIDRSESIRRSQEIAMERIAQVQGVLSDPAPSWWAEGYRDGGIELRFQGWVDQRVSDLGKVRTEALRAVKSAFTHAGISCPRNLQYVLTAPLPAAVAADLGLAPTPEKHEPVGTGDTSVNRDLDGQLHEEQQAHGKDNLI